MSYWTQRKATWLVGVVCLIGTTHLNAQVVNPYLQPGVVGGTLNPAFPSLPNPFTPGLPWWGFNPFANGNYMSGAADVYRAQGQFLIDKQMAWLKREQVKQARVDTQRKIFDEWLYERERTPRPEDVRQQAIKDLLARSLNNPPANEIVSGVSLNSILTAIEALPKKNVPPIPLDEEVVRKLSVTRVGATEPANPGLLRDKGNLTWPKGLEAIAGDDVADAREKIVVRFKEAYRQAAESDSGKVDPNLLRDLSNRTQLLEEALARNVNNLPFNEYSEAKRYLRLLRESLTVLGQADAREWVRGGNVARGRTVAELVQHMTSKGLRFAPAVGNAENAYAAVHAALVKYYQQLAPTNPAAVENRP